MNPELQRNLWLEASPRRLAWAAAAVATTLASGAFLLGGSRLHIDRGATLAGTAYLLFVLAAGPWGARAAGGSVTTEMVQRTWDFQRLSALSPWSLAWGKLLGSTALVWIVALTSLAIAAGWLSSRVPTFAVLELLALSLGLALLVQAAAFDIALVAARKARIEGRSLGARGGLAGLIATGVVLIGAARAMIVATGSPAGTAPGLEGWLADAGVSFYGAEIPRRIFLAASACAFAGWAVFGAWRLMRVELQLPPNPAAWISFLLFLAAYQAGLAGPASLASFGAALPALLLCAYGAAFAEPADPVRARRLTEAARRGAAAEILPRIPLAAPPLVLAALCALAAFGSGAPGRAVDPALVAFAVRDLGVIAYFRNGPRPQRGDVSALVALAVIWSVGFSLRVGDGALAAAGAPDPAAPLPNLLFAAIEAALVWVAAAPRILRRGVDQDDGSPAAAHA